MDMKLIYEKIFQNGYALNFYLYFKYLNVIIQWSSFLTILLFAIAESLIMNKYAKPSIRDYQSFI